MERSVGTVEGHQDPMWENRDTVRQLGTPALRFPCSPRRQRPRPGDSSALRRESRAFHKVTAEPLVPAAARPTGDHSSFKGLFCLPSRPLPPQLSDSNVRSPG